MFTLRRRVRGRRGGRHQLGSHLQVSCLENRLAPAQLVVTSAADDGTVGTLRSILSTANKNGEADTITFDAAVTAITLAQGQLTVSESQNLTIDGGGTVTINGAGKSSIVGITAVSSPTISIANITLENGKVFRYGGAITMTSQKLFLTNVSFLNNKSTDSGGALSLTGAGSAVLTSCRLVGNEAEFGGAISLEGYGTGSISLYSCLLEGNIAIDDGFGGAIYTEEGKVVIDSCIIQNNQAGGWGGGIELLWNSFATITNSTLAGNVAEYVGGIDVWRSSATIVNCTISENTATNSAGGILFLGYGEPLQSLVIRNSTIAKNTVADGFSNESGGLVTSLSSAGTYPTIQIDSTIIASNFVSSSFGTINRDVILPTGTQSALSKGSNNLFGAAIGTITGSNNLIGTEKSPINAGLLPIGDYGGPIPTMALQINSIAVDKGSNLLGLLFDQRGQPREVPTGLPDIGAVEGTVAVPYIAKIGSVPNVTTVGGTAYKISVTYDGPNGIDLTSIDGGDIKVSGPAPVGPVTVTGITTSGNQVIVSYQFAPPGGSWDQYDIGTYSVRLVENEVWDLALPAQFAPPQTVGTFKMQVAGNFVVNSISDTVDGNYGPGQVTLREAVQLANVFSTTSDTITFDPAVFSAAKTIVLADELSVSTSFKIIGPGADLLTLSGNGANRIFYARQASINANGLTLANGHSNYVYASDVDNGTGGAIYGSSITLVDCVLINNTAEGDGGAIYGSSVTLVDCVLTNNSAELYGGAIYGSLVTLTDCVLANNSSEWRGGAIHGSTITLVDCVLNNNSSEWQGGAIYAGTVSLTRCSIVNNSSPSGGGIFAHGTVTLENSTISGNTATNGGGLFLSEDKSQLIARNSTIANNSATQLGGGVFGYLGPNSPPTISVTLSSTIVAKNVSTSFPDLLFMQQINVTGDNNLIGVADNGNVTYSGVNNKTGTYLAPLDPLLGPLAANFASTPTHALLPGSPAINAGSNPANLTTDQRGTGFVRVVGGQADIGAFEVQAPPRVLTINVNDGSPQRSRVTSFQISFSENVIFPSGAAAAFALERTGPNGPIGSVNVEAVQSGNLVTVTFVNGGVVGLDPGGSLPDGKYKLTIIGANVFGIGGDLDGDGNGTPGGNATFTTYRLFGDSNGSGKITAIDFADFRTAFGTTASLFDFNDDGVVAAADFAQFRLRYLVAI